MFKLVNLSHEEEYFKKFLNGSLYTDNTQVFNIVNLSHKEEKIKISRFFKHSFKYRKQKRRNKNYKIKSINKKLEQYLFIKRNERLYTKNNKYKNPFKDKVIVLNNNHKNIFDTSGIIRAYYNDLVDSNKCLVVDKKPYKYKPYDFLYDNPKHEYIPYFSEYPRYNYKRRYKQYLEKLKIKQPFNNKIIVKSRYGILNGVQA